MITQVVTEGRNKSRTPQTGCFKINNRASARQLLQGLRPVSCYGSWSATVGEPSPRHDYCIFPIVRSRHVKEVHHHRSSMRLRSVWAWLIAKLPPKATNWDIDRPSTRDTGRAGLQQHFSSARSRTPWWLVFSTSRRQRRRRSSFVGLIGTCLSTLSLTWYARYPGCHKVGDGAIKCCFG